jgi:hypothetical protein
VQWTVIEARPVSHRVLAVRFVDGTSGRVDLTRLVDGDAAGVFEALRDEQLFAAVMVTDGAVSWPNGLDLAPDAMYDAIRETGSWSP